MNRMIVLALVVAAACGSSRKDQCAAARDKALVDGQRKVEAAIAGSTAADAAKVRAEGEAELAAMKAQFVDACVSAETLDLTCFDNADVKPTSACKEQLKLFWGLVYAKLPSPL